MRVIVGFFVLASLLIFSPAIYRPAIFQVFGGDVYHNLWIWGRNVSNVMAGAAPYFPNIFFPDPLSSFYSEMEIGHSIIYGLLTAIGLHPIRAYLVIVILAFALTGIMVALIARRLGASNTGAIIGGSIAAFASYRYNQLSHVQLLAAYWMLVPLYFSLSFLLEGNRRALILAAVTHFPVLCGPSYNLMGLIVLESGILLTFALDMSIERQHRWRRLGVLSAAVSITAIFTVPMWLGYFELFRSGFSRSHSSLIAYAVDLVSFLTPLNGSLLYDFASNRVSAGGQQTARIDFAFVGFVAIAFISVALFRRASSTINPPSEIEVRNWKYLRAFKWAGILMLLLSLGDTVTWHKLYMFPNPIFKIGEATHFLAPTRYIAHYAYLGILALSFVVAYRASMLFPNQEKFRRMAAHIALAAVIIVENFTNYASPSGVPDRLVDTPSVYNYLATLPANRGVVFLPFPLEINDSDASFRRQYEYMFYSQFHRLAMFNGVSGFFPPHYTQGPGLFADFPNLPGLSFILRNHIDYVVYDKHSGRAMDFSAQRFDVVCHALLTTYSDADYEVFEIKRELGAECISKAGSLASAQWVYLASKATPHQVGQFDVLSNSLVAKQGEQGALAFGPYVALDKGKYRASFTLDTFTGAGNVEIGSVDVNGYSDTKPNNLYTRASVYAGKKKHVVQLEFEVVDSTLKHEFRVLTNGAGRVAYIQINLEKI